MLKVWVQGEVRGMDLKMFLNHHFTVGKTCREMISEGNEESGNEQRAED